MSAGKLILAALAFAMLGRSSGEGAPGGAAPSNGGTPPAGGGTPPAGGGYPDAPRTGFTGADAWRVHSREVHELARAYLEAQGADVVEQQLGAHLAATIGQLETSGRAEYGYNIGNIRPVRNQPRGRQPNGMLFRVFPTRRDGVIATVRLAREGARYRDAYAEAVRLAREGEPLEPLVGALVATLHDRGYDEAPQSLRGEAREQWVRTRAAYATRVADLVSRALNSARAVGDEQSQPATSAATQQASQEIASAITRAIAPAAAVDAGTVTRAVE